MGKKRNCHVGGEQLPLIEPSSAWVPPSQLPDLRGRVAEIAEDTETRDDGLAAERGPGWAIGAGHLCGVSWAWAEGSDVRSIYVPLRHPDTQCFQPDQVRRWMEDHRRAVPRWVYQNAPYDLGWTRTELGLEAPEHVEDTSLAAFMVDENRPSFRLDDLCSWLDVPGKDERGLREAVEAFGYDSSPREVKKHVWRLPARHVGPYAEQDAVSTLQAIQPLRAMISSQKLNNAYQLDCDLIPLVVEMRRRGVRVNVEKAIALKEQLLRDRDETLSELGRRLSCTVGVDAVRSAAQIEIWCDAEGVRYERTEKSEQGEFQRDWMRSHEHWLPRLVARARQLTEAADKFVQSYVLDFAHRGRLHPTINQWKTETGGTRSHRFSYADPPLQQAPSRPDRVKDWVLTAEIAAAFRDLFEPEDGELWDKPDYSQQEFRLIVHYAERLKCVKAEMAGAKYRGDLKTDFHTIAADLTKLPRRDAKDVNFAKAFGAGKGKFAEMTGTDLETAAARMTQYDEQMPFVRQLSEKCQKRAEARGYVKLIDGARNHFEQWEASWLSKEEWRRGFELRMPMGPCSLEEARERQRIAGHPWAGKRLRRYATHKAMSRVVQGSAARMTKKAMRDMWREKIVPLLQMHDELDNSVGSKRQADRIEEIMRDAVQLTVPVVVESGFGSSWGRAKLSWEEAAAGLRRAAPRSRKKS